MNRNHRTAILLIGLLALVGGCSDDDPAKAEPAPILTITNSWGNEAEADHNFNFASGEDGETSGAFTGEEVTPDNDDFDLTGSWSNGRVEFTVQRDEDVTWVARFTEDNPTRLEFESGEEQLVLLLGG